MLIRELPLIMRNSFSGDYELVIRQKPLAAKAFVGKEKDRKPIDPPPIIQLRVSESVDPTQSFLQSPYYFISCSLLADDESRSQVGKDEPRHALAGTLVSSLHRLKDIDNTDAGFFVFGDLSVRIEGIFRLQFTLYEFRETEVAYIKSTTSDPFTVYASKNWPGMAESTVLTRSFSDQGVRLRLRKEPRFRLGARGPASDNYEPRRYRTHNRKQSQTDLPPLTEVSQHAQQLYQHPQEGILGQRQAQSDYSGRVHQQQQTTWQTPTSPAHSRKRDHSQSSYDTSYASHGTHGNHTLEKRARTDLEPTQQSYGPQQYLLGQEYGGRLYSDTNQATGFPSYPQLSSQQLYGSTYASSPLSMTPRDQGNFYVPRRGEAQYPSTSSAYDIPGGRQPNSLPQQSPISAFGFTPGFSSIPQTPYSSQQNQYIPQLTQPPPPSKPPVTLGTYTGQPNTEQPLMQPRPGTRSTIDVLPPVFGGNTVLGMGRLNSENNQQPVQSGAEDPRFPRSYVYDFRPTDNAQPR